MKVPGNRRKAAKACVTCKVILERHTASNPKLVTTHVPCFGGKRCSTIKPRRY